MIFEISLIFLVFEFCCALNGTNGSHVYHVARKSKVIKVDKHEIVKKSDFLVANETKVTHSIARLLDIFDSENLILAWDEIRPTISEQCALDVDLYIEETLKGEKWTLKMQDSSGRYSDQWFNGNDLWMGSSLLCKSLNPPNTLEKGNKQKTIKSKRDLYVVGSGNNYAPFVVGYYTVFLSVNASFEEAPKVIYLGVCMPKSCHQNDTTNIIEGSSKHIPHLSVTVFGMKLPQNRINIWSDVLFLYLCAVTYIAVTLIVAGTLYDYYLESKHKKHTVSESQVTLDIDDAKENQHNGRRYVTNSVIGLITKEVLLSFSAKTNLSNMCNLSLGPDSLPVVHGLKTFSMAWVIIAHSGIYYFTVANNKFVLLATRNSLFSKYVNQGIFSVDTFLFTSGLLLTFVYCKSKSKSVKSEQSGGFTKGVQNFFSLIFYRYARLSVPYMVVIVMTIVLDRWVKYNTIFDTYSKDYLLCVDYWWRNILYINNLYPLKEMCMISSWYLADDTQYYALGGIILIISATHKRLSLLIYVMSLVSGVALTIYIAYIYEYIPISDPLFLFDELYDKPWTRLSPYLVGMATGYYLNQIKGKLEMSLPVVLLGWTASIGALGMIIFGFYDIELSGFSAALHAGFSHLAWGLSFAWVVVACSTGYGGPINAILSAPIHYPFSRVTYSTYLIHICLMRLCLLGADGPLHMDYYTFIVFFAGIFTLSYVLAFPFSLTFEAPAVGLLKLPQKIAVFRKEQKNKNVNAPT